MPKTVNKKEMARLKRKGWTKRAAAAKPEPKPKPVPKHGPSYADKALVTAIKGIADLAERGQKETDASIAAMQRVAVNMEKHLAAAGGKDPSAYKFKVIRKPEATKSGYHEIDEIIATPLGGE